MLIKDKIVTLKNRKNCVVRSLGAGDAGAFLRMMEQTYGETDFMSRYPEEKMADEDNEALLLQRVGEDDSEFIICAVIEGRIVGNLGVSRVLPRIKCRHRAELGISILQEYWGLGIGRVLMETAEEYARRAGFEQIELEVVADNKNAVSLYAKMGYVIYGERPCSFKYKDNSYGNMYLMLKDLKNI